MKRNAYLALLLSALAACDVAPPLVNELVENPPETAPEGWQDVFLRENPNASEYRLINVNSQQILSDADQIRITLLDGDIVTAMRRSSEVYDGSIHWVGVVEGALDSHVEVTATSSPYMKGHVVIGERVEFFAKGIPGAYSIIFKVNPPDRAYSRNADILPDADPSEIDGMAWKALVYRLPASALRIVTLNIDAWRKKMAELEQVGWTEMRFIDNTQFRVVTNERGGYPQIEHDDESYVLLHNHGGPAGLSGSIRSTKTGDIRVTPIEKTGFYILWVAHPEFRIKID